MKARHHAVTLRVPGAQVGGMRRIAPNGSTPLAGARHVPVEGGVAPQTPTPHQARRHVTTVKQPPPRISRRRSRVTPTATPAATAAVAIGQAVAARLDELAFAANQPGSYQRMGGF